MDPITLTYEVAKAKSDRAIVSLALAAKKNKLVKISYAISLLFPLNTEHRNRSLS